MKHTPKESQNTGDLATGMLTKDFGSLGRLLIMPGLAQLVSPDGAIMSFLHPTENQINNIINFLS